jgi:hypothetical protein
MKTKKIALGLLLAVGVLGFTSCNKDVLTPNKETSILPSSFGVNIPDAISYNQSQLKSADEAINGKQVYEPLGYFIKIGEGASEIVQKIILSIAYYHIDGPITLTYKSDEDGRDKKLVVVENAEYAGKTWEFELTITDVENEQNADGGKALQLFWNRKPIEGIAILKPANCNVNDTSNVKNALFRIDYSEAQENGYTNEMTVYIANLPLANPLQDPFSCNAIRLWAGKDGNFIDVRGNSNHPNARFFDAERQQGFNWAFVASSDEIQDIACVEVALPPSDLNETSRDGILTDYSIRNVFEKEIFRVWPELATTTDQASLDLLDSYFVDAEAPGFFNADGFVKGGATPGTQYDIVQGRIEALAPFSPNAVSTQTIEFK